MNTEMNLTPPREKKEESIKNGLIFHIPKSLKEIKSLIRDKIIGREERTTDIEEVPYLELKLKNSSEVYRIARSYLLDMEKGKKSFGFVPIYEDEMTDFTLLAIASCISYSKNNSSILVVVKDLADVGWDKYREKFKIGTLGQWKTKDWGNICLVDYKELMNNPIEAQQTDLNFVYSEFDSILWALPSEDNVHILRQLYLSILRTLDSVAIVLKTGKVGIKDVKKVENHYSSLGIPLKGILQEGGKI